MYKGESKMESIRSMKWNNKRLTQELILITTPTLLPWSTQYILYMDIIKFINERSIISTRPNFLFFSRNPHLSVFIWSTDCNRTDKLDYFIQFIICNCNPFFIFPPRRILPFFIYFPVPLFQCFWLSSHKKKINKHDSIFVALVKLIFSENSES